MKYRFGKKIRAIRERKNITLKEVAESANVSESLVSQIERNKVSPSIDTLLSIADVLEIDPEYLFRDYKKNKKVSIIRSSERSSMRHKDVVYHKLSSMHEESDKHSFEVFMLEVEKGAEKGDLVYGHQGKELGILLEGEGELIYGNKTHKLAEGDSVTFSSEIPHVLKNTGDGTLKAIWVTTPSRSLFSGK